MTRTLKKDLKRSSLVSKNGTDGGVHIRRYIIVTECIKYILDLCPQQHGIVIFDVILSYRQGGFFFLL